MSDGVQRDLTITLPVGDWQLVNAMLQQVLQPYQRLGQVLVEMQKQAMGQQAPKASESRLNPVGQEMWGPHEARPRVLP